MKGDYDKAIQYSNKALEIDPKYAWSYHNRGAAYAAQADHAAAVADYRHALALLNDHDLSKNGKRYIDKMQAYINEWGGTL